MHQYGGIVASKEENYRSPYVWHLYGVSTVSAPEARYVTNHSSYLLNIAFWSSGQPHISIRKERLLPSIWILFTTQSIYILRTLHV